MQHYFSFVDATAEFIAGVKNKDSPDGSGLSCVTVLIGAFIKATGEPVMGVVNQPFYNKYIFHFVPYYNLILFNNF